MRPADRPRAVYAGLRRLAHAAGVLFGISVLVFLIFLATPGADPAARLAGRGAAPETLAQVRREFGLDRPLPVQYATLMWRLVVTRDLPSFVNRGQAVPPAVLRAAPVTLAVTLGAAVLWCGIALVVGVAAVRAGRAVGALLVAAALLGVSVPGFWLAAIVAAASQHVSWAPPLGQEPEGLAGWIRTLALPWLTLATLYAGIYARVLRTGLAAALRQDYARTARAKGLGELRVLLRHALPNAMGPPVALLGLDVGALLGGGTVLIEAAFGLHGVGRLTYDALLALDLPMVMACVLYSAAFVVAANLASDALQSIWRPRR